MHWQSGQLSLTIWCKSCLYVEVRLRLEQMYKTNVQTFIDPLHRCMNYVTHDKKYIFNRSHQACKIVDSISPDALCMLNWCHFAKIAWAKCISGILFLTLVMWGPCNSYHSRSISWVLLPLIRMSPVHQQSRYWSNNICTCFFFLKKDFIILCHHWKNVK